MFVIPAIDIRNGKCVRLFKGDYNQETVYANDPREILEDFSHYSFPWVHIVDLDGARSGMRVNKELIAQMASSYAFKLELGGGVRAKNDVEEVLSMGIKRVIMGTALTTMSEVELQDLFSTWGEQVVAGVDAKDGMVAIHGWEKKSELPLLEFLDYLHTCGAARAIVTDISTDGTLAGPAVSLYTELVEKTQLTIIASGGVGTKQDLKDLQDTGVEAVIVGKALYEGRITLEEIGQFNSFGE